MRPLSPIDRLRNDADEEMHMKDWLSPNGDVFSYFTLTSPNEHKRHGYFTVDAFVSHLLVITVLTIQWVLLYCVCSKVIAKSVRWQNGIINTGHNWDMLNNVNDSVSAALNPEACVDTNSLCHFLNGTLTCAPPIIQLIGRWEELDLDGDDVWTRADAMRERDAIKCKFGVDTVEVFDVLIALLKHREEHIWLHPHVTNSEAIHKVYFTYILGDLAICGYRDVFMCGNLMQRGFFDAAIKHGTAPRVGDSIRTALDYCNRLLEKNGLCQRILPSAYQNWRIETVEECGRAKFERFVKKDPRYGYIKSILEVDYDARRKYEVALSLPFNMYKICLMFIWMLFTVSRLREDAKAVGWVVQMPLLEPIKDEHIESHALEGSIMVPSRSALTNDELSHIPEYHRVAMLCVKCCHMVMTCCLCCAGLAFLGRQTDYILLVMDGLSLVFVIKVEQIVYKKVLRQKVRSDWQDRDPITFKQIGPQFFSKHGGIADLLRLFCVAMAAILFQVYYTEALVQPLYTALECSCLSQGETCFEAQRFSASFWDNYWTYEVPASRYRINSIMHGLPDAELKSIFNNTVLH